MEDRWSVSVDAGQGIAVFGVFDGHGGQQVSIALQQLPKTLLQGIVEIVKAPEGYQVRFWGTPFARCLVTAAFDLCALVTTLEPCTAVEGLPVALSACAPPPSLRPHLFVALQPDKVDELIRETFQKADEDVCATDKAFAADRNASRSYMVPGPGAVAVSL